MDLTTGSLGLGEYFIILQQVKIEPKSLQIDKEIVKDFKCDFNANGYY